MIWDIHHLQERFYFEDDVLARLENSMQLLVAKLDKEIDENMSQYHNTTRAAAVWVGGKPMHGPVSNLHQEAQKVCANEFVIDFF